MTPQTVHVPLSLACLLWCKRSTAHPHHVALSTTPGLIFPVLPWPKQRTLPLCNLMPSFLLFFPPHSLLAFRDCPASAAHILYMHAHLWFSSRGRQYKESFRYKSYWCCWGAGNLLRACISRLEADKLDLDTLTGPGPRGNRRHAVLVHRLDVYTRVFVGYAWERRGGESAWPIDLNERAKHWSPEGGKNEGLFLYSGPFPPRFSTLQGNP